MAINDGKNFDPSKRVKEALGEDFVSRVEDEALERLSKASKTAVRNNSVYEENRGGDSMNVKNLFRNAVHTTKAGQERQEAYNIEVDASESAIFTGLQKTHETWNRLYASKDDLTKSEKILNFTLGASKCNTKKQNIAAITGTVVRTGTTFLMNDLIETHARMGDYKNMGTYAGIGAVIDGFGSYFAVDDSKIKSVFANVMSKQDSDIINSRIKFEKALYAAEHATAGVIAPALIKFGVDNLFKCKNNKVIDGVLSFGTFSTVGKVTLQIVRKLRDKNLKDKLLIAQLSNESSSEYYKLAASHVTRAEIDKQLDPTIIAGVAGSAFGFLSVELNPAEEESKQTVIEIPVNTSSTEEKPKTVKIKPVAVETEESKPAKIKVAKKSA